MSETAPLWLAIRGERQSACVVKDGIARLQGTLPKRAQVKLVSTD